MVQRQFLSHTRDETDPRFEYVTSFPVRVPQETHLDTFRGLYQKEGKKEFTYFNSDVSDEHFAKIVTVKLVPGACYAVKVILVKEHVSAAICLAKLQDEKAVLVGPYGLILAYQQGWDYLPKGKFVLSLDKKEGWWKNKHNKLGLPYMHVYTPPTNPYVSIDYFDHHGLDNTWVLLAFCPVSE